MSTGQVIQGPATVGQPVYQVRENDGQIQVRRSEYGGLRRNPVTAARIVNSAEPPAS
jgi:hypothetical protein